MRSSTIARTSRRLVYPLRIFASPAWALTLIFVLAVSLPDLLLAQLSANSSSAAALGAGNQSFAAIAQRAVQTSPDLLARRSALDAQSRGASAASAAFGPRLDFSATAGYERSMRLDSAGAVISQNGSSNRATLNLRQPLYDGAEVSSETERLGRLGNVRFFELRQAEDALLFEMGRAWVDLARQRTLIEIAQANLAAHERLVALVQTRVSSGVGRGVDLDQAQGRLSSARLALASDYGALGEASARFQRLAQVPPPANIQWFVIDPIQMPASENESLQQALTTSPAVRAAAENSRSLEAEVRVRRAAFLPRVALEGRHDLTARTSTLRDAATSSVLLTFNYNLYAGGGDSLREQDVLLRLASTKQQFQDSVLGLRQSVASTWAEQLRQAAMNANATAYAGSVSKARDVYRIQYDIGQRSLLDLLNTENELAQAQRQQTNSRADAQQAQLRLLSLSGRLHPAFSVPRIEAQPVLAPIADPVDMRGLMIAEAQPALEARPAPSAIALPPTNVTPAPMVTPSAVVTPSAIVTPSPIVAAPSNVTSMVINAREKPAAEVAAAALTPPPSAAQSLTPGARPAADRNSIIAGRFASDVVLRLPESLNRSFGRWLEAVETGRDELMSPLYQNQQTFSPTWSVIGLSPGVVSAKRLRLIQAEQIDADRDFKGGTVQIALLAELSDAGGKRCVRSAQLWRNQPGPDISGHWQIARERAVTVSADACRNRG